MSPARPRARREGILTENIDGGLVVVDSWSHQAHALSALAATIWARCDGRRTEAELAAQVGSSTEQVEAILAQLSQLDLVETPAGIDRRGMLGRTAKIGGMAALAAPILTVVLPTAVAHASAQGAPYDVAFQPGSTGLLATTYNVTDETSGTTGETDYDHESQTAVPCYVGAPASASASSFGYSAPSDRAYVEVLTDSDGDLLLTLVQYQNAGSASFTGSVSGSLTAGTQQNVGSEVPDITLTVYAR